MMKYLHPDYCVRFWGDELVGKIQNRQLKSSLDSFFTTYTLDDFRFFMKALEDFAFHNRVWVIIDEVLLLDPVNLFDYLRGETPFIILPEEQTRTPFYFIITGSAGIASWVEKRHLKRYIFDLPLFSKDEGWEYALKLRRRLGRPPMS